MAVDFQPFDELKYVSGTTDELITITRQPNGEWTGAPNATTIINDRWVADALEAIPNTHRVLMRNGQAVA